jgi:serine phosphatase RsbU (regulator of sigma subunit)/anti-sigma regulatory factor (Ser/Thr protein kinase)
MTSLLHSVGKLLRREKAAVDRDDRMPSGLTLADPVDIAPNDPLLAFFQSGAGAVDIENLSLESPGLRALRQAGVRLVVPLVSQGELIGLLNLGPRLSEQEYSSDDRRLLETLAGHVAPAVRVAQLVREQEAEARGRERIEQELRIAQIIQQNFLPQQPPAMPGWRMTAHYQPAREVGGDFYDFISFPDGRLGIVIGDVTDKGVPAALVMAATRSSLRAAAQRCSAPGEVLRLANDLLCPDIPPNMFATCLYCLLDPATGRLVFANAGHNLPYVRTATGVHELRAVGMPLGLMPDMEYEEKQVTVAPGECVLFHSDGLAEAHNPANEMFGFPRLMGIVAGHSTGSDLIPRLLRELKAFAGDDREQEDDVTLVTLTREPIAAAQASPNGVGLVAEFSLESAPGNERAAVERVVEAIERLEVAAPRLERLKTAVAEATMNAMEHGNHYRPELAVCVRVLANDDDIVVQVVDQGGGQPVTEPVAPDLDAKLAGEQSPRGWGLFLIENMVDDMRTESDGRRHTIELVLHRRGE